MADSRLPWLSDERQAELDHARAETRNQWRISNKLGDALSEAEMVRDMVLLEMKFSCSDLNRCLAVAKYAHDWLATGNPFYIDGAVYLCGLSGIQPPPALAEQAAEVAKRRFFNTARGGTADQILKENARGHALAIMAKLCAAGATRKQAASKVARYMQDNGRGITFKADTLQKYYSERWRHIEADLRRWFADDPAQLAEWQQAAGLMPEADEDQQGE